MTAETAVRMRTGKLLKTRDSVAPATYKAGGETEEFAEHALRPLNARPMQWSGSIFVDASCIYKAGRSGEQPQGLRRAGSRIL